MKFGPLYFVLFLLLCGCENSTNSENTAQENTEIIWGSFTTDAFEIAKKENKLVFLDIGANWCHWCHVMDDSTYTDYNVQTYLSENFVLCREDQDARPDLYANYRKWGWPALIVFNADGEELLKLKGYQPKRGFLKNLEEIRESPLPLVITENEGELISPENNAAEVLETFTRKLDYAQGGYNWRNKTLPLEGIQLAVNYYDQNDSLANWADLTIENSYQLVDPVWSGVYQYSAKRSWNNQHYEKLLKYQAAYILAYSQYGAKTNNERAIETAVGIYDYCIRFLGNETPLFYNSQNADLVSGVHSGEYYKLNEAARLEKGTPSVDETIYLKENAAFANALIRLWAVTGDGKYLARGIEMTDYILANYLYENGLYKRELTNQTIFSMEDNRQFLETLMLYGQVTDNTIYKDAAYKLGDAIIKNFNSPKGLVASAGELTVESQVVPKDNLNAVLTFNLLGYYTKNDAFIKQGYSIKGLQKSLMQSEATLPSLLLYQQQMRNGAPFTAKYIEGEIPKSIRQEYIKTLMLTPNPYIIFQTAKKGEMTPEDESFYGGFDAGTLFMCTNTYCSAPITSVAELELFLNTNN